ncbi:hypothetical protein AJ88_29020 [Mesorhizobium amorphae CCBAU 01583]|nr:hypothetical protein AJ88_29020 [Mesorhizobium amorphae CCBAU 01583]
MEEKASAGRIERNENARDRGPKHEAGNPCRLGLIGIYAVQFVAARFSLREHLTATDLAILRFAGAGMVMLPVVWRSGLATIKALGWRRALTLAALAGLPYPIIINWGLTYAPAAHGAALCPASIVFFSFLLSHVATTDKASRQRTIGVAAIIAGLILFIAPARIGDNTKDVFFGDLLFIASGAMFAAYAVLVRRWRIGPVTATATVCFCHACRCRFSISSHRAVFAPRQWPRSSVRSSSRDFCRAPPPCSFTPMSCGNWGRRRRRCSCHASRS